MPPLRDEAPTAIAPLYLITPECALGMIDHAESLRRVVALARERAGDEPMLLDVMWMGNDRRPIEIHLAEAGMIGLRESAATPLR